MFPWKRLLGRRRPPSPAPFIVGVARSGTTLLRLMLDSHPEVAIPPETYFLLPFLRGQAPVAGLTPERFRETVTGVHTWPDLGISPESLAREVRSAHPFSLAEGTRAVYLAYARRLGKSRWGDKTPAYRRHLAGLESILPEARFVHIVRDGRDVALSLRPQWFTPSTDVAGLARHWREEVEATRLEGARCRHYLEVRYEDLLTRTRSVLEEVCGFLALPFDPAMESYHRTAAARLGEVSDQALPDGRVVTRESRLARHRLASSPPDASRIGVWRSAMTEGEQRAFREEAGSLLRELGYDDPARETATAR